MAIQVVEAYPNRGGGRRFLRFVVAFIGALLLLTGLIALGLAVVLGALMVLASTAEDIEQGMPALAALVGIAVVGLWLGLRAIRGRRRLGLFLRRFGYLEATRTMSATVAGQAGRMWRMVTLDDANIAPVGTTRANRRMTRTLAIVAFLLVAGAIALAVSADATYESTGDFGSDILGPAMAEFVRILYVLFVLSLAAVVLVIGIAAGAGSRAARAATERASVVIDRSDQVQRSASQIRRNNRRVFGSRLVVARVATPLWQDVVRQLAAVSDAVVIDVSLASDNLLWEVENMRVPGRLLVLVCHRERIANLLHAATGLVVAGPQSAADVRLARALDGHEVLVYGSSEADQQRFARSLRNRLATT